MRIAESAHGTQPMKQRGCLYLGELLLDCFKIHVLQGAGSRLHACISHTVLCPCQGEQRHYEASQRRDTGPFVDIKTAC